MPCWWPSTNQGMWWVSRPSMPERARCFCCSCTRETQDAVWAADCSMPRMTRCGPRAAAKCSCTRTNKITERWPFTRPPGIDATARSVNRTFVAFTCASRACCSRWRDADAHSGSRRVDRIDAAAVLLVLQPQLLAVRVDASTDGRPLRRLVLVHVDDDVRDAECGQFSKAHRVGESREVLVQPLVQ